MGTDVSVFWASYNEPGLEHLRLVRDSGHIVADGVILRVRENEPFRAHYNIHCQPDWSVQRVDVQLLNDNRQAVMVVADGMGHWTDDSGNPIPALEGCLDVDISATPFTNTLAIRRLQLKPGESAEISVAYVSVPEMKVSASRQQYTCLQQDAQGGLYRYVDKSLVPGFTADLEVDSEGLLIDYPPLFKRIWMGGSMP